MQSLTIYTDGGCWPNPGGLGGWGAVILRDGCRTELSGVVGRPCTNNRAELTGAIQALSSLMEASKVTLISDSEYLVLGASRWSKAWERRNYRKVKNLDLWRKLFALCERHEITWKWVRGHAGDEENCRCDFLANEAVNLAR